MAIEADGRFFDQAILYGKNGERYDRHTGEIIREPRVIEASVSEPRPVKPSTPDTTEDDHARALLKLHSAKRMLRTYRAGLLGMVGAAATFACMGLGGIGVAIASSVFDFRATGALVGLEVSGWPGLVASVAGLFAWQWRFRIDTRHANNGYRRELISQGYIDPQLNLEIRQLEYSRALAALAHKGLSE